MIRTGRRRRVLKWAGMILSMLIAVVMCASAFVGLRANVFVQDAFALQITSSWGTVVLSSLWPASEIPSNLYVAWLDAHGVSYLQQEGWLWAVDNLFHWPAYEKILPNAQLQGPYGMTSIAVPYWILFLLVAIPTAVLWWRGRRCIPSDCCRQCGYNLTGNVSGVCPECGEQI
ncbi:MAG: hypothetical protein JXA69_04520 [Phycisphaerae bacterium]|nr:hypothetical protein [Phycisphaerae bacterium]